ncbi:hypothetical protein MRB53_037152 [Persea americana]|nr:hypothetical protein MRB53_037152 [Persea americana]
MLVARIRDDSSCKHTTMLQPRVTAAVSRIARVASRQGQRRWVSDHGHGHDDGAHSGPANESFGVGQHIPLKRPSADGKPAPFTRIITAYADYKQLWEDRNALHTKAVEQAGHDRNLFLNTPDVQSRLAVQCRCRTRKREHGKAGSHTIGRSAFEEEAEKHRKIAESKKQ